MHRPAHPFLKLSLPRPAALVVIVLALLAGGASATAQAAEPDRAQADYATALKAGFIKGIRSVTVIRSDLLAVTLDGAITHVGNGMGPAGDYQKPAFFAVTSAGDAAFAAAVHPTKVGRASYEVWNGVDKDDPMFYKFLWWHTYYLQLPAPLHSGQTYTISLAPGTIDAGLTDQVTLAYDDSQTTSEIFKINQVAYNPAARRRYAYLGWWAGDLGAVDYSGLKAYDVIDEASSKVVLHGQLTERQANDDLSGEDVYQIDLSALPPGTYHIAVPGLARSETFHVGGAGVHDLYYYAQRAFYHQRCGQELKEPWTWVTRPACHVQVYESGHLVGNPNYTPQPGEPIKEFRGGYHDAADFDTFTYHLYATADTLIAFGMHPEAFGDDLNLPESGNGVPDIIDEAVWGLSFDLANQLPDGEVPLGRGNECDAFKQNTGGKLTPFGVLPPWKDSTGTFAGAAAQLAHYLAPYDKAASAAHLAAARRAYDWAKAKLDRPGDPKKDLQGRASTLAWGAMELFVATGEKQYADDIAHWASKEGQRGVWHWSHRPERWYDYLHCTRPGVDKELQQKMKDAAVEDADKLLKNLDSTPYRHAAGHKIGAWGSMLPATYTDTLLLAYDQTRDQKYLDAVSLQADFQLGCNPLSKTAVTGMGYRHPNRPEISAYLYENGSRDYGTFTVKGYSLYFIGPPIKHWYPATPPWRSERDLWGYHSETYSEFTVHQTIGPSALMFEGLYGAMAERQ